MNPQTPSQPPGKVSFRVRLPVEKPLWTYILIGVNIAMYLVLEFTGGSGSARNLIRFGANYAPLVTEGEYWRLLTAGFLHIGVLHILFNMYALYVLGRETEPVYGRARFIVIYLLSGICGSIFSYGLNQGLSAGASTSLFGLFGALAVFFYRQRKMLGAVGRQQLVSLGIILAINIVIDVSPGSGIDIWGHAGGLIGGVLLSWVLCPVYTASEQIANTFSSAAGAAATELPSIVLIDTNPLRKQALNVGLFGAGLVVLTLIARLLQT